MTQQDSINYASTTLDDDKKKGHVQPIDEKIGERLKGIRKKNRLTQADLAQILGVSFQQFQKYENGKNRMSFGSAIALCEYLKMPLDSFVDGLQDVGLADGAAQEGIAGHDGPNIVSQKETDELLKLYYSIEDPKLRKSLLKLVQNMVENMKD